MERPFNQILLHSRSCRHSRLQSVLYREHGVAETSSVHKLGDGDQSRQNDLEATGRGRVRTAEADPGDNAFEGTAPSLLS